MGLTVPLQVSWFLDYVPKWLSLVLLVSGLFLLIIGYLEVFYQEETRDMTTVGIILIATGLSLIAFQSHVLTPFYHILVLTMLAKWIEGVSAIRFYQKLASFLDNKQWPRSITLKETVTFKLASLFAFVIGGWAIVLILVTGPFLNSIQYDIALVWTLMTLSISFIGLSYKFWAIRSDISPIALLGLILLITGGELANLRSLSEQIWIFIIGNAVYTLGYWGAAYLWLTALRGEEQFKEKTVSRLKSYSQLAILPLFDKPDTGYHSVPLHKDRAARLVGYGLAGAFVIAFPLMLMPLTDKPVAMGRLLIIFIVWIFLSTCSLILLNAEDGLDKYGLIAMSLPILAGGIFTPKLYLCVTSPATHDCAGMGVLGIALYIFYAGSVIKLLKPLLGE